MCVENMPKQEPEPVLTLAWLQEYGACEEALEWLAQTVEHTHPPSSRSYHEPTMSTINQIWPDAIWPLPAVIKALLKAGKWNWLDWLYYNHPDAARYDTRPPDVELDEPDYPADRVKELEVELARARKDIKDLNDNLDFPESSAWFRAFGTVSTLKPQMIIDLEHPERMAEEICAFVKKELAEAHKKIDTLNEICDYNLKKFARRDRLEAEMGNALTGALANTAKCQGLSEDMAFFAKTQVEKYGTPEARARFEGGGG